ncbi:MAG: hypothetical protein LBR56_08780 [Sporomusaceae bacterium]|nr:hypothetical protein [Sporomusaceae bacterium]
MRLRRRHKRTIDITPEAVVSERAEREDREGFDFVAKKMPNLKEQHKKPRSKKKAKKTRERNNLLSIPASLVRKISRNPNFNSQLMVIAFSLLSDAVPMAGPLENMTAAIEKARNISDVLNNTMQSVKVAAEVPKQIRHLLK